MSAEKVCETGYRHIDNPYLMPSPQNLLIPEVCPVCGGKTEVRMDIDTKVLCCTNPTCDGKLINKLDHFCGKKGLDIKGLSKATLEKLIAWEWISNLSDIMLLINHRDEWIQKPGFGQKSVDKILDAIAESKTTTLDSFISSLGIPLIGQSVSKELIKHIESYEDFRQKAKDKFDFSIYNGFAENKTSAIWEFDFTEADKIYPYLNIEQKNNEINDDYEKTCENLKIVITGKLGYFKNRESLKSCIELHGGKVVNSISSSVNYLINNDIQSNSSKNLSAKELGIPILSEEEFIKKFNLKT